MNEIRVSGGARIETTITVPGDKSISHRAVLLSALTNGTCKITNYLEGEDCLATIAAMRSLGVQIEQPEPNTVIVQGCRGKFTAPEDNIYCGNSGTSMRLLSGLLAGQPFESRLTGDASLSQRPMNRVMNPLKEMGGVFSSEAGGKPPLTIHGRQLNGIVYELPVASAQVKSAILLAGLYAEGRTTIVEPTPSRDHTERMLQYYLASIRREGNAITIHGNQTLESRDFDVPGDISSAAFWLVAAAAQEGAQLHIENVGLNQTRTGIIDVLVRMGARIREVLSQTDSPEPRGLIDVKGTQLHGTVIQGSEIPNVIDELPILAVAAALAEGRTEIRDAAELRVKETDRIAAVAENLRLMKVPVEEYDDGMAIQGGIDLRGARLQSYGDHRIAMAFAIAGLFATGETIIENAECVNTSYPGFVETLQKIGNPRSKSKFPNPFAFRSN
ncbi:MAG: 3-phosphoshikimate 1-carboxyvinyltransferase [Chthoniobacterales bacterium]